MHRLQYLFAAWNANDEEAVSLLRLAYEVIIVSQYKGIQILKESDNYGH